MPIVATHEIDVTAEISGDARAITVTPQAGVTVLGKNSSGTIGIFAPTTPTLTVTASWRQSVDPANSDETGRCSASRDASLPVLAANPARGVRQVIRGAPRVSEFVTFAVAPALKRPNLSPLEISIRSTGHVRYPRRNERLVKWSVPMRNGEQLRYRGRLPNLAYADVPAAVPLLVAHVWPRERQCGRAQHQRQGATGSRRKQRDLAGPCAQPTSPLGSRVRNYRRRLPCRGEEPAVRLRRPGEAVGAVARSRTTGRPLHGHAPERRRLPPVQGRPREHTAALIWRGRG